MEKLLGASKMLNPRFSSSSLFEQKIIWPRGIDCSASPRTEVRLKSVDPICATVAKLISVRMKHA
eukprot:3560181-Amphidinium_carterae.1